MPYKKILCAVDFSSQSQTALKQAVKLARLCHAKLFFLHALEAVPVISQWLPLEGLGVQAVALQEKARESLEGLVDTIRPQLSGIDYQSQVTSGHAFEEILENARVWGADLIVIGAKGAAAMDRVLFGSTADRVLKQAECSVLVVNTSNEEE